MSLIQTQEKVLMQKNCKSFKSFFNHAREGKKIRNRKGLEEFSTLSFETFPLSQAPLNKPPCHRMACPPLLPESQAVLQLQNRKEAFNPTQGKHVVKMCQKNLWKIQK